MEKYSFNIRKPLNSDLALQITSMADIFIILLVFLLKSFNSGAINIMPSPGLKLPEAATTREQIQALNLEISESAIQVDNRPVTPLKSFQFDKADLQPNGISVSLDRALETQRKRQDLIAKSNSDVQVDSKILVIADGRAPYGTIKSVLSSAAIHGFSDFKLVVLRKE